MSVRLEIRKGFLVIRVLVPVAEVVEVVERRAKRRPGELILANLTPRQREILGLVLGGMSNKEIARLLSRSIQVVKVHVSEILRRTGALTRYELIRNYGIPDSQKEKRCGNH